MWLIKVVSILSFTALCAAQTAKYDHPETTLLPMLSVTPTLSLDPPAGQIYQGERAVLSCSASGSSPDWTYLWYHEDEETPLSSSDPKSTSYTISAARLENNGTYWCRIKRGEEMSAFSKPTSLTVIELPKPVLAQQTRWLDVFPSETVQLSCTFGDNSDWTFTWFKDGKILDKGSLAADGSMLTITPSSQSDSGNYNCRGQHKVKPVTSEDSNSLRLVVYEKKPKPTVTQTPNLDEMYTGEAVSFSCKVDVSSGWEYVWYKNTEELQTSEKYVMTSPSTSNSGQYSCQAKRGKTLFYTEKSEAKSLHFSEPPKPLLERKTSWLDVFQSEKVELSCAVAGSSDWTFTWYKDGKELQKETLSLSAEGSTLTIPSATQADQGSYACKGHHKSRKISSGLSGTADITVYENKPKPTLSKDPDLKDMYVGETLSISCTVGVSSGWEYLWYRDGKQLSTSSNSKNSYIFSSLAPSDGGMYTCKATRGTSAFPTEVSEGLTLNILDIPFPSLELQTPWHDVFASERVEMSCRVPGRSDWTYTWYRDGKELAADENTSLGAEGSFLNMTVAKGYGGGYNCSGHHKNRAVKTEFSNTEILTVYPSKPKPTMTQTPDVMKVYVGESVSFDCRVGVSTDWEYVWYKNGARLPASGDNFNIDSANSSNSGIYKCMATRGKAQFNTEYSEGRTIQIYEIPTPSLKFVTPWDHVFQSEHVELSCDIQDSADWTYRWYRDGEEVQLDRPTLTIQSASITHAGQYNCRGRHKNRSRSVSTKSSNELTLKVYDNMPDVTLVQSPEDKEMHTGDSLSFTCEVDISSEWTYLWFKDGQQLSMSESVYRISSAVTENSGSYQCQAKRQTSVFHTNSSKPLNFRVQERPKAVMTLLTGWAEVFSTDSLVLECEVQDQGQYSWNYTWYREGQEIDLTHSKKHIVTPQNDPDQSQYTCNGVRNGRPFYSVYSESFKTRNLLLKRRVLLSISGCLFFGLIAVFIGCIALRVTRKPDEKVANPEESNLFLTMAELKARDDAPNPLVEYITDAALNAPAKDGDDNGAICSESTPLPITSQEDQAVTPESVDTADSNGGLKSFKQ